ERVGCAARRGRNDDPDGPYGKIPGDGWNDRQTGDERYPQADRWRLLQPRGIAAAVHGARQDSSSCATVVFILGSRGRSRGVWPLRTRLRGAAKPRRPDRQGKDMHPDLTTLKIFLAVVEGGSMAKAAAREHITVFAVSKRIMDLEALLGVVLLERHSSGIR